MHVVVSCVRYRSGGRYARLSTSGEVVVSCKTVLHFENATVKLLMSERDAFENVRAIAIKLHTLNSCIAQVTCEEMAGSTRA